MKKKKKKIILSVIGLIILLVGLTIFLNYINDENRLSSAEKRWINNNINNVNNIYVSKDSNIFSNNGTGVYYDFLNDLENEYGIKTNPITVDKESVTSNLKFDVTKVVSKEDSLIYKDHYVVVSKNKEYLYNLDNLNKKRIGVSSSDYEYVSNYLKEYSVELVKYDSLDKLYNMETDYIIVPRIENINLILNKNYFICNHLSDLNNYYVFRSDGETLSSIISKYLNRWLDSNYKESFNKNSLKVISSSLSISDTDLDKLRSIDYNYGFVNNSPYEVIMSGDYGGIVASYLQGFSELSGVKFNITKFKNNNKLESQIKKGSIDIYFDFNKNIDSNFTKIENGIKTSLTIATNKDNDITFNSVYGLINKRVYVLKNSILNKYLNSISGIDVRTYDNIEELYSLNNKNEIIVLDTYQFDYLANNKLNNYSSKYNTLINNSYNFKIEEKYNILNVLFNSYINIVDESTMINNGINLHESIINHGNLLNTIAKYIILSIIVIIAIFYLLFKNSKKIKIGKRIKKDDKMKFIDQLTSLKNRNYLSGFIKDWNNNTIYPQTVLVIDLNKIKYINDKYGYDEGDKQIQACANALIKTQLDNSEIMRSGDNEFVIYLVGYTQKQITNYINKLNKEIKKLPYDYGAEFGYSFIENDLKTIEDALNEAIEDMKKIKESVKNGK